MPFAVTDRRLRWIYRATALLAVLPIAVAAVRNGLRDWEPTWDAAITAVRVRDVFSPHPPLTGLYASASDSGHAAYSYLGAIEFYVLAVPVHLFGTTWGILLGMAAINSTVLLVALWLVRRRVGELGAIVAAVFVASLLWTLGSETLIDLTPMQAGILPFFALLLAAWSVADGDRYALPILAVLGNYLVLLHLKFVLVVPIIGIAALICWVVVLTRERRSDPERWPRLRRRQVRWLLTSIGATVVMWIPVLYDQFISENKNLGNLIDASINNGGGSGHTTLHGALGAVVAVTAVPPLWLPSSFADPPFGPEGGGQSLLVRVSFGVILLALVFVALWWTRRHHDHTLRSGLTIAGVAWLAWVATWMINPNADSLPIHYFWGLWPLSAFVWYLLVMTAGRAASQRSWRVVPGRRWVVIGCGVLLVVVALLAMPRRNHCGGHCASGLDRLLPIARQVRAETARVTPGKGPVMIITPVGWPRAFEPSMMLGLQDAGVDARVMESVAAQQYGAARDIWRHPDAKSRLYVTDSPTPPPDAHRIARFTMAPTMPAERYADLNRRMHRWADAEPGFPIDPRSQLREAGHQKIYRLNAAKWVEEQRNEGGLLPFARFLTNLQLVGISPQGSVDDIPGMTPKEIRDWALETERRHSGTFYMYQRSLEAPTPESSKTG